MYNVFKQVIEDKNYKLGEIVKKINTIWVEEGFSDEQREELIELARKNANIGAETPEMIEMLRSLSEDVEGLKERVEKLENGEPVTPPIEEEYPAWKPWDGLSKDYQKDAKVSHNGKKYISTYDGQNIWEPGVPGIDERYWSEVVE